MPVYKDAARGSWYVRIYSVDPITGRKTETKKRGFATKRDALLWEAQKKTETAPGRTGVTFRQLDERFIQYKGTGNEQTKKKERDRVSKYMADFADLPVEKITKAVLLDWYLQLGALPLAPATKNQCIRIVRGVFRFGARFYDLPNPAAVLKPFKAEKKEMATWSPAQFSAFLQAVPEGPCRDLFFFLYWTGVRRGEALALRAEDFSEDAGTVKIWHQMCHFENGFLPLKTEGSARVLNLPAPLWAYLRPVLARCTDDRPFVFGGSRPPAVALIHAQMKAGMAAAGVPVIRLHDLRHSFATNAINNGCNIVAVSKYLGHASIQQTLSTYTHLLKKTDAELVNTIGSLMP